MIEIKVAPSLIIPDEAIVSFTPPEGSWIISPVQMPLAMADELKEILDYANDEAHYLTVSTNKLGQEYARFEHPYACRKLHATVYATKQCPASEEVGRVIEHLVMVHGDNCRIKMVHLDDDTFGYTKVREIDHG